MNNYLLDCQPLIVLPELACAIGLNEAVVLQQVHYWVKLNEKANRNYVQGRYWTFNSYEDWQRQFPFWSLRTVKTVFTRLENIGLLVSGNFNEKGFDRTKWYTINYEKLASLLPVPSCKSCTMHSADFAPPIPDNNTDINNEYNACFRPEPGLKKRNDWFDDYIEWYFDLYKDQTGRQHPRLKLAQMQKVKDSLVGFCEDNEGADSLLYDMAEDFFKSVKKTDYNINHFVSEGILENRLYRNR